MIAYVQKDSAPKLPDSQCSVVIELAGSQTTLIAKENLTRLGKNADKPMDILIMAFYKAQAMEYERKKREITDTGGLTKDFARLIKIKTLDEAQGDEAGFVFVDYVAASFPGFLGEDPGDHPYSWSYRHLAEPRNLCRLGESRQHSKACQPALPGL
ncbi:hypothetical protein NM208_g11660 [Fusarium decemcellulare]|uniref:Uncharacterized protein n=1 Tax=Fusarium decemcellulare TaxID=57161 RepID=A0ACC1RU20_9HYPO|nr:hypothetical protein NM208_g11660 [Fusarium decemcellulare]